MAEYDAYLQTRAQRNDDLVRLLGGDAHVLGFYDARVGISSSGGFVDSWRDCRGLGYAPVLAGAGAARPSSDGTSVHFDGVDDILSTDPDDRYSLQGAKTLAIITSKNTDPAVTTDLIYIYATDAGWFGLFQNGAGFGGDIFDGVDDNVAESAVAAVDNAVAVAMISKLALDGEIKSERPHVAADTAAGLLVADVPCALFLDNSVGTGTIFPQVVRAVIVLDHAYSDAERDAILEYAVREHGAVLA